MAVVSLGRRRSYAARGSSRLSRAACWISAPAEFGSAAIEAIRALLLRWLLSLPHASAFHRSVSAAADRFERYLVGVNHHEATRYKIATAGSSGNQFTDLADATAKVLYEAKGVTNRMSVRLALGQVLDYGRYVKKNYPGTELAILLPQQPPADMIKLLKSLQIGCVVEEGPGVFVDRTGLDRCP